MAAEQPDHISRKPTKSRRRKKRRTEDFSSSSSSSSSSDSESDKDINNDISNDKEISVEDSNKPEPTTLQYNQIEHIKASVQAKLKQVHFTEETPSLHQQVNEEMESSENTSSKSENPELDQAYLHLMTSQFGDDLDELRKKPDFNQTSLMVLVEALKSSKNIFDENELEALTKQT